MKEKFFKSLFCLILIMFIPRIINAQPAVVQVWPQPNRIDVPVDTTISIQFSENMDESNLTNGTIFVYASQSGFHLSSNIEYNSGTKVVNFNSDEIFFRGEMVTVILTSGVRSFVGEYLDEPYIFRFSTKTLQGSGVFTGTILNTSGDPGTVTACDIDNDNDIDLVTETAIMINDGNGFFSNISSLYWGATIESADLDHDGDIDLAMTVGRDDEIKMYKNDGNGNYTDSGNPFVGDDPVDLEIGDFDGDGDLDLAVVLRGSNSVAILENNSNGVFSIPNTFIVGSDPRSIICGDYDSDNDLDLAVTNDGENSISILLNNGGGNFVESKITNIGNAAWPRSITCGDYDGDDDLDLAVSNDDLAIVSILENNGSADFVLSETPSVGVSPTSIISLDVDGDSDLDLCVANSGSNFISLLRNDGNGSFIVETVTNLGRSPVSLESGDLNNDGYIDIAAVNTDCNRMSVFHNTAHSPKILLSVDTLDCGKVKVDSIKELTVSIYNESGESTLQILDVITSNSVFTSDITIMSVAPRDSSIITISFHPQDMIIYYDSLIIYSNDPDLPELVLYVSGVGNPILAYFPVQNALVIPENTNIFVTFSLDIFPITCNDNTIVLNGSQSGRHSSNMTFNIESKTLIIDPDKDFFPGEVVTIVLTTGIQTPTGTPIPTPYIWSFTVAVKGGSGLFQLGPEYSTGANPESFYCSDLDGDQDIDIISADRGDNTVTVLLNHGDGSFQDGTKFSTGNRPISVISADLDGDNDMDLAVTDLEDNSVSVLRNKGDGSFQSNIQYPVGTNPESICCNDFDGDGALDLVTANIGTNTISVLFNRGYGSFYPKIDYIVGNSPTSVFSADFDLDGDQDLAITTS